jgi:hypothetical protein
MKGRVADHTRCQEACQRTVGVPHQQWSQRSRRHTTGGRIPGSLCCELRQRTHPTQTPRRRGTAAGFGCHPYWGKAQIHHCSSLGNGMVDLCIHGQRMSDPLPAGLALSGVGVLHYTLIDLPCPVMCIRCCSIANPQWFKVTWAAQARSVYFYSLLYKC